ncbi:MAG: hypothetical protein ACKOX3_03970 [Bacteroidota bacterium]
MNGQSNSPWQLIWQRFKQNRFAIFGLGVVLITVFFAVFSYLFIPDKSSYANQMCLEASMLPPGSSIHFLKVKSNVSVERTSLRSFFLGSDEKFQMIPVSKYSLVNGVVSYQVLGGANGEWDTKKTNELVLQDSNDSNSFLFSNYYLLGTDKFGRDVFSRLILASRVSIAVGFIAVIISLLIGVTLGALAGYYRGITDDLITWLVNVI